MKCQILKPDLFDIALCEFGVSEIPGLASNSRINEYHATVGLAPDDDIPWCSAFINWCCEQIGIEGTGQPNARSWMKWGTDVTDNPRRGDVVVFWRGGIDSWKGHVGIYVTERNGILYVLGGNQGNQVNIKGYTRSRLLGIRRAE